nr:probable WRKY transcription factor 20 [Ipomoea batatas]
MEDSQSHSHSHSQSHAQHHSGEDLDALQSSRVIHAADGSSDASDAVFSRGVAGSNCGARYKLMSPAKLPIARSAGITIPPGLSPTSFLESPVLLSNIKFLKLFCRVVPWGNGRWKKTSLWFPLQREGRVKAKGAEPSPTTGSFSNLHLMQGSGGSAAFSFPDSRAFSQRKSSNFEFKFPIGSSSTSASTSIEPMTSAGLNQQQSETQRQVQNQFISQSLATSSVVESSIPTSNELNLSSAVALHTSSVGTDAIESDDLNQRGKAVNADQSSVTAERSSDDEYNWRKYGQKLVKGSEFPRSYYKCTYPNCEVKKIFERSPDGKITEIVYKGSHDHPKPQPSRRFTPGAMMPIQEDKFEKESFFNGQEDKFNSIAQTGRPEPSGIPILSPQRVGDDIHEGATLLLQGTNDDTDDDDPFSKRRKMDGCVDITPVVKPIREPRVVVQTVSEVDILDDGYRWRKYGQKVVRGNPNPRSYYKCTNAGCPVRKHVERASHDPKAVITTYEGKHNHDLPAARTSSHEMASTAPESGISRVRPEENDVISLDLGVGIGYGTENRTNDQLHSLAPETVPTQVLASGGGMMAVQAPAIVRYGIVNGGINRFGSRENHVQAPGFETLPLQSSNQCPQTLGRILMGP